MVARNITPAVAGLALLVAVSGCHVSQAPGPDSEGGEQVTAGEDETDEGEETDGPRTPGMVLADALIEHGETHSDNQPGSEDEPTLDEGEMDDVPPPPPATPDPVLDDVPPPPVSEPQDDDVPPPPVVEPRRGDPGYLAFLEERVTTLSRTREEVRSDFANLSVALENAYMDLLDVFRDRQTELRQWLDERNERITSWENAPESLSRTQALQPARRRQEELEGLNTRIARIENHLREIRGNSWNLQPPPEEMHMDEMPPEELPELPPEEDPLPTTPREERRTG